MVLKLSITTTGVSAATQQRICGKWEEKWQQVVAFITSINEGFVFVVIFYGMNRGINRHRNHVFG